MGATVFLFFVAVFLIARPSNERDNIIAWWFGIEWRGRVLLFTLFCLFVIGIVSRILWHYFFK